MLFRSTSLSSVRSQSLLPFILDTPACGGREESCRHISASTRFIRRRSISLSLFPPSQTFIHLLLLQRSSTSTQLSFSLLFLAVFCPSVGPSLLGMDIARILLILLLSLLIKLKFYHYVNTLFDFFKSKKHTKTIKAGQSERMLFI